MPTLRFVASLVTAAAFALTSLATSGCAAHEAQTEPVTSLPALPERPSFAYVPQRARAADADAARADAAGGGICELDPSACPSQRDVAKRQLSTEVYAVSQSIQAGGPSPLALLFPSAGASTGASGAAPAALPVAPPSDARAQERIEIQAQFAIQVADVEGSAGAVRQLARANDGTIGKDERQRGEDAEVQLVVRVPSERFEAFAAELERVGKVRARNVKEADVAFEERDLAIVVTNLEAELVRYRELLAKANNAGEMLPIEREIERVTVELSRVKGQLAALRDRIARATVAISLSPGGAVTFVPPEIAIAGRGEFLYDMGKTGTDAYVGGGLSLRAARAGGEDGRGLTIDVDLFHACCRSTPARSDAGFDALLGWDVYMPGYHHRAQAWLVPFGGGRIGYAELRDRGDLAVGGIVGVDVFRSASVLLELSARALFMAGNGDGPHLALAPNAGVHLGF